MAAISPRLAIGLSQNPTVFDGTGILSLCIDDPNVRPPLERVLFHDHVDPIYVVREVTLLTAPRGFRRTGYGTQLRWEIELMYQTVASGYRSGTVEGDDNSLFALSCIAGLSAGGTVGTPGASYPPYFFVTTTFQMDNELWIPAEYSATATQQHTHPLGPKTYLRSFPFELKSTQPYKRIQYQHVPAYQVKSDPTWKVVALTAPGPGVTQANITTNTALPAEIIVGDAILINFNDPNVVGGGPYVFFRFILSSINVTRTLLVGNSAQQWPYAINILPPAGVAGPQAYRTQHTDSFYRTPLYALTPFVGSPPVPGFTPMKPFTQLIGGLI